MQNGAGAANQCRQEDAAVTEETDMSRPGAEEGVEAEPGEEEVPSPRTVEAEGVVGEEEVEGVVEVVAEEITAVAAEDRRPGSRTEATEMMITSTTRSITDALTGTARTTGAAVTVTGVVPQRLALGAAVLWGAVTSAAARLCPTAGRRTAMAW